VIPARYALPAALASLYLIWGSTYFAIAVAVRSLPPLLMAGLRFVVAGSILLVVLRLCGQAWPDRRQWLGATLVGSLLLLGGNGTVCLVAHAVPSGVIALVLACTTLFVVLVGWLGGGSRPTSRLIAAIACGLVGVGILVHHPDQTWPVWGILALLGACLSWALGTVVSKRVPQIPSPWIATGAQMLTGGVVIIALASARGEWADVHPETITQASLLAWGYLVFFGSICGFGSYVWLLRHASPALATSYGYVNPVVALGLGAWLNSEILGVQTLIAGGVIVASVALIATAPAHDQR
jgi:drug/metabolite transporter (DMT)-like permease